MKKKAGKKKAGKKKAGKKKAGKKWLVVKKKVKEKPEPAGVSKTDLERFAKHLRAEFPKTYAVQAIHHSGQVRVNGADGMFVASIDFDDMEAQKVFGK